MPLKVNGKPFKPFKFRSASRSLKSLKSIPRYTVALAVSVLLFSLSTLFLRSTSYKAYAVRTINGGGNSNHNSNIPDSSNPPRPPPPTASHRKASHPQKITLLPQSPPTPNHNNNNNHAAPPREHDSSKHKRNFCKWEKYAKWPYVDEYRHLLSPYRRKLLYVKTPKSSSSTTAHLLQRYTNRSGLLVGYPDFAANEWTFQSHDSLRSALKRSAQGSKSGKNPTELDALVSHIVYNKTWVDDILNSKRPFRVTSVREPISRSWSMYTHGKSDPKCSDFLMGTNTPMEFARKLGKDSQLEYASGYRHTITDVTPENISGHYDHIVVSERVLDSLLTLAPKLGLKASDLLYISQKAYGYGKKIPETISKQEKKLIDEILRSKSGGDHALHKLANERIDAELRRMPKKISSILNDIPQMLREVKDMCDWINPVARRCLPKKFVLWDGDQMCISKCIEAWAKRNIMCS